MLGILSFGSHPASFACFSDMPGAGAWRWDANAVDESTAGQRGHAWRKIAWPRWRQLAVSHPLLGTPSFAHCAVDSSKSLPSSRVIPVTFPVSFPNIRKLILIEFKR